MRALSIERLEGSRRFGRAIAYWVFNRNRILRCDGVAIVELIFDMAVALPKSSTRSVRRASGFVQVGFLETITGTVIAGRAEASSRQLESAVSLNLFRRLVKIPRACLPDIGPARPAQHGYGGGLVGLPSIGGAPPVQSA